MENINTLKNSDNYLRYQISDEEEKSLESNKILKENKVDYIFIMKHYGKCHSFLSEIIQTEGITMYEHQKLKEIIKVIFIICCYELKLLIK